MLGRLKASLMMRPNSAKPSRQRQHIATHSRILSHSLPKSKKNIRSPVRGLRLEKERDELTRLQLKELVHVGTKG